MLVDANFAY
uniref:Uncharacterized protein n=1 Tax=Rhizophora mucronata TaxID=61149 RepID=A0A2P2PQT9_RHIMU